MLHRHHKPTEFPISPAMHDESLKIKSTQYDPL